MTSSLLLLLILLPSSVFAHPEASHPVAKPQLAAGCAAMAQVKKARETLIGARKVGDVAQLKEALRQAAVLETSSGGCARRQALYLEGMALQSLHRFDEAVAKLDLLIADWPKDAEGRITRGMIYLLQGKYDAARKDCISLMLTGYNLLAMGCNAQLKGVTGAGKDAAAALEAQMARETKAEPAVLIWSKLIIADIYQRTGEFSKADESFKEALVLSGDESFVLHTYTDFLLRRGDFQAAKSLIARAPDNGGTALRKLIIAKKLAEAIDPKDKEAFLALELRGDHTHDRELARFYLDVEANPSLALSAAQNNFKLQKEPIDVELLSRSALAAGDTAAQAMVKDWIATTHVEL